jgi:hypothetical protein
MAFFPHFKDEEMSIRHTLSSLYYLPFLVGITLWQFGCGGNSPDNVIIEGDNNLPGITLTSQNVAGDGSELVGIGSTIQITWKLTGELGTPIVKLYLDKDGNLKTTDDQIEITPSAGVDGNAKTFDFTPTTGLAQTGVDYTLVAKLFSGGNIFEETTPAQKIRIGDGGIIINSPAANQTLARGLPVNVTWNLTNNICEDLKDKLKFVRLYISSSTKFSEISAIEVTAEGEEIEACTGTYTIKTGEVDGLKLGTAYYVIARLYIDGIEAARSTSQGAFTATTSLNVTAPEREVVSNFQAIPVSWEVVGRSAAGLKVEIVAQPVGEANQETLVERIISQEFAADQGTGLADASKLPSGTYNLIVRLFERDASGAKISLDTAAAPGQVVIPNGYNGTFDLADMAAVETTNYSPIDGLVFEGFNIDEQLGFEVAGVGDITGDGFSDFLLFSRFDQQYTTGNAGGAYLILGQKAFPKKVINVNSVASPEDEGRVVNGSLLLLPMENLATMQPGSGKILGTYTAIGMPDVSGDQIGDLLIGCPDAAPLQISFENMTTSDVTIQDHFDLPRTIPAGGIGIEPAHVHPTIAFFNCPMGDSTINLGRQFGNQEDDWHYAPGDTIHVVFSVYPDDKTYTDIYVEHLGEKRGTTYLVTSQRLTQYNNKVYDLAKIGSPVEDGVSDTPTNPMETGRWIWWNRGSAMERCEMVTWYTPDAGWGTNLSVMGDINGDGYPNRIVTVPHQTVTDINGDSTEARSNAGLVQIHVGDVRYNSILTQVGQISYMWPDGYDSDPGYWNKTDGRDIVLDIIGSQTGSELSSAAGLGKFVQIPRENDENGDTTTDTTDTTDTTVESKTVTKYINGDYNNDQVPDLVLGAPGEASGTGDAQAGCIYIVPARAVFGRRTAVIDLADFNKQIPVNPDPSLAVPVLGVKVQGTVAGERLGEVVKPAGDFNGDGLADVMFSTPTASAGGKTQAGRLFIMFGQKNQLGDFTIEDVDSHLGTQLPAIIFEGENEFDNFGTRIVAVADVNGDGLDDILVAAPNADAPNKLDCGKIYLIYGKKNIVKTDPATGFKFVDYDNDNVPDDFWSAQDIGVELPGAVFLGEAANNHLQAMAQAGDVNGDGVGDFLIGAPNSNVSKVQQNAGKAYVVFGRKYVLPN